VTVLERGTCQQILTDVNMVHITVNLQAVVLDVRMKLTDDFV